MNKIIGFDKLRDGTQIKKVILSNKKYIIECISLGATLTSFQIKDDMEKTVDVVLGYNQSQQYIDDPTHFGMTIGRYANRIANGRFVLDNKVYYIDKNHQGNSLHSGKACICWHNWKTSLFTHNGNPGVKFETISIEGEDNWPGTVKISSSYELTEDGKLILTHIANTNSSTYVNLTNHSYFNLSGNCQKNVLNYSFKCDATNFVEVDDYAIPSGSLIDTTNTPFDFKNFHSIGERISEIKGYDHCLVFPKYDKSLKHRATLVSTIDNLKMEISTTLPAMQIYTSNNLKRTTINKCGKSCIPFGAICLETQYFPDSPNHNNFPSTRLDSDDEYREITVYQLQKITK
jgi:aldose 1-epimerase